MEGTNIVVDTGCGLRTHSKTRYGWNLSRITAQMRSSTLLVAGLVSAGAVASSAPPEIVSEENSIPCLSCPHTESSSSLATQVPVDQKGGPEPPPNVVWLCGDSTMAPGGGHNGTEGWGEYLRYSFMEQDQATSSRALVRVNNSAYAGRSARTFTREGRFQAVAERVRPGDWAVLQFGHNDGRESIVF